MKYYITYVEKHFQPHIRYFWNGSNMPIRWDKDINRACVYENMIEAKSIISRLWGDDGDHYITVMTENQCLIDSIINI
jgi:S-adenosylmethionine:diacylglycerol 3-amino-3-carboxypropyl transferase